MHSFYTRRSQKQKKKTDSLTVIFAFLGSLHAKAAHKMVVKSTTGPFSPISHAFEGGKGVASNFCGQVL